MSFFNVSLFFQVLMQLENLPHQDILITCIFPYLDWFSLANLRETSKLFQGLVDDYLVVAERINFRSPTSKPQIDYSTFVALASRMQRLKQIHFPKQKQWLTNCLVIPILKNNKFLQELNMEDTCLEDEASLIVITVNNPHLETLRLDDCEWATPQGFEILFNRLPNT